MAKQLYRDPYDPQRPGPVQRKLADKKSNRDFEMDLKRVRPGEVAKYYDPQIDRLKTAADKEEFDRAGAVRASQSGFSQHLASPKGVQRSSADPMQDEHDGIRQVGQPGPKFQG